MILTEVGGTSLRGMSLGQVTAVISEHPERPLRVVFSDTPWPSEPVLEVAKTKVEGTAAKAVLAEPKPEPEPAPEPEPEPEPQLESESALKQAEISGHLPGKWRYEMTDGE